MTDPIIDLSNSRQTPPPRLRHWPDDRTTNTSGCLLDTGAIDVWIVDLDGDDPEFVEIPIDDAFGGILSLDELTRAKRLVRPRDRLRFARCRVAVRQILGRIQGIDPSTVKFGAGPHGKPFLEYSSTSDSINEVEFNVSHSGGLALVAVSRIGAIGVDLELIRTIRESDRIVASFFNEAEQAQFGSIAESVRDAAFMRGWTRKEAILKCIGQGLAGGPSRYETMFGTNELTRQFQPVTPCPIVNQWMLWEAEIRDGYVATLAASIDLST